jgi:hypothetical protein
MRNDLGKVGPKEWEKPSSKTFATGIGSAAAVIAAVAKAADTLAGFPMRLEEARGSATQSFVGRDVSAIQNGTATFDMPWMQERAKAAEMARSKRTWNHITDIGMGLGGAGLMAGGAAVTGLAGWTGAGALLGGGMMAGGAGILANDRYRSAINPFGQGAYNELLNQQQGTDTLSTWEALKQQDPRKGAAIDRLQGRFNTDLQTQRMMGMGYNEFAGPGGFQETANQTGFTGDMAAAMAAQMQGAGSSTRGMRGLSTVGLQAQRGYDLTNAGSVLGRVAGGAGGAAASEQVFRKIMEESVKAGLDKSEFREEQRRFADVTSDILSQAGVKTAEDAERTLQGFSKFLGNAPTTREMTGAKSAYDEAQGFSAETSGRGGALQFAGMLKNNTLKGLGVRGLASLSEIPEQDINSTNPLIIAEASKAGVSPEELARQVKDVKTQQGQIAVGLNPDKMRSLNEYLTQKGNGDLNLSSEDLSNMKNGSEEDRTQYAQYMRLQEAAAVRSQYQSPQKRQAVVLGLLRNETDNARGGPEGMGPANAGYDERMAGTAEARPEDLAVRAAGEQAQQMLENFRNFKDEIAPATAALHEFIKAIMDVKTATGTGVPRNQAQQRYLGAVPGPLNQSQGSKPMSR